MMDLLKELLDSGEKAAFLLPGGPVAVVGTVEALTPDRVTLAVKRDGKRYRFVTHPNTVVLTEEVE